MYPLENFWMDVCDVGAESATPGSKCNYMCIFFFVTHYKKMSYLATTGLDRLAENSLLPSFACIVNLTLEIL